MTESLKAIKVLKIAKQFFEDNFSDLLDVQQYGLAIVVKPRNYDEVREFIENVLKFEVPEFEREFERKEREIEREMELELE
ncbi:MULTISPECIES: hypothetical protein [unclassified Archaeoglobus]|uniref:hypothetical protein n=1 Tax=unclassified Archaeoglobus TaxID=2643606 RepID=UPI0025C2D8F9|nr:MULTISPECIES: hypothetical protein [unclassified Archaeoglobus]